MHLKSQVLSGLNPQPFPRESIWPRAPPPRIHPARPLPPVETTDIPPLLGRQRRQKYPITQLDADRLDFCEVQAGFLQKVMREPGQGRFRPRANLSGMLLLRAARGQIVRMWPSLEYVEGEYHQDSR